MGCDSKGMKRSLLIAGGTLGSLGGVLAITPPQLTATQSMGGTIAMGAPAVQIQDAVQTPVVTAADPVVVQNPPTASVAIIQPAGLRHDEEYEDEEDDEEYEDDDDNKVSVPIIRQSTPAAPVQSATPAPVATATKKAIPAAPATTATKKPTPVAPAPVQKTKSVSGTFTGSAVNTNYGTVQVKITVANGKITDAQAIQAPTGRNDRWTQMSVPVLRQRTLAAQSANINGVSGASYTSYGWHTSLVSALKQAGL